MKTYKGPLKTLPRDSVFVFGSNTQGRHGKGAALWARLNAGALYGQSQGPQGRSYAIITRDISEKPYVAIKPSVIAMQITLLYSHAVKNNNLDFYIAYMDAPNLNGYTPQEMADMFKAAGDIPDNVIFEESFAKLF